MKNFHISFSPDRVAPLVSAFEKRGWDVWWDRHISTGTRFDREIERDSDTVAIAINKRDDAQHELATIDCQIQCLESLLWSLPPLR